MKTFGFFALDISPLLQSPIMSANSILRMREESMIDTVISTCLWDNNIETT